MVIDSSALLAILLDEPERRAFNEAIEQAAVRRLSVANLLETSIVIETRYGAEGLRDLDHLLAIAGIERVAVDLHQVELARRAFSQYGQGRHPAGLNFGDCFAYALAKNLAEPILFKGRDFSQTDLEAVLAIQ